MGQAEMDAEHLKVFKALRATKQLSRHVLHQYRCRRRGCMLGVVFAVPGTVVCYVPGYKYSRGLNERRSSPEGRQKNAVDGDRRWPEHAYDVPYLAGFTEGTETLAGMAVVCPHYQGTLNCGEVMRRTHGVTAGRPGAPTLLPE